MNENTYVRMIRQEIEAVNGKSVKYVPEGTGKNEPDIIGTYDGQSFVVEAKVMANTATPGQLERLKEWADAGAIAVVATYPHQPPRAVAQTLVALAKAVRGSFDLISQPTYQSLFDRGVEKWKVAHDSRSA